MEPIFELSIDLPSRASGQLLRALHRQLRAAIVDGRLQAGVRLPPTRALAERLGVSRNTAIAAYDLLLSEGYLQARTGAGTFVADMGPRRTCAKAAIEHAAIDRAAPDRRLAPFWRGENAAGPQWTLSQGPYDFRTGLPDITQFPFDIWQRLSSRAARCLSKRTLSEGSPQGRAALRAAIAKHVSFARAVACEPDDIIVTTGTRQAVDLIARILVTPGHSQAAIEDPCYPPLRLALGAAGARIHSVPVDDEGLIVEQLPAGASIVCVAPSHQYPLGVAMSVQRRAALLDYAHASDAVIIEDDYDSEFRLAGRPLDALQTLDRNGCVFYVGTFAKAMFNAVRVGFIVAPPWARSALVAAKQAIDGSNPLLVQDALAAFISEGHLARHIRRMRKVYAKRHAVLLEAIDRHCRGRLRPRPSIAGVHIAAELTGGGRPAEIAAEAAQAGIAIEPLDRYTFGTAAPKGLVFGYGMIEADQIEPALRALGRILR